MIIAGRLRHRIVIQSPTETINSYGEREQTWATFATVWASIEPMRGRELLEAQQINAELSVKIRIRYLASVKPKYRISWDSRTFEINSIANIEERDREIELMCTELVT